MVALALAVPASSAASSSRASRNEAPGRKHLGTRGYLVADPAAYARNKAEAARRADQPVVRRAFSPHNPVASPSFEGQFESDLTPPDTTGAIGPRSYVQFVNLRMGIYDRSGNALGRPRAILVHRYEHGAGLESRSHRRKASMSVVPSAS